MVKQRMGSVDVAAEVACLREKVVGLRLANLYDLNAKTYVLKLAKSGTEGEKVFLLLESGARFHTVQVIRDKPDAPSNFTLKLRKHLRTRRLEGVRQLGVDRVIDFTFGAGESAYHLILEMYAQGNVILTNHKYEVLTLLRSHRDDDKGLAIMARHPYPMQHVRLRTPLRREQIEEALAAAASPVTSDTAGDDATAAAGGKKGGGGGDGGAMNLKGVVAGLLPYGPGIAEHVVASASLDATRRPATAPLSAAEVGSLFAAVQQLEGWFAGLDAAAPPGYITAARAGGPGKRQRQKQAAAAAAAAAGAAAAAAPDGGSSEAAAAAAAAGSEAGAALVYEDFNPLRLAQGAAGGEVLEFPCFDDALDEFYSKIEGQRVDVAKADAERAAMSRLERVKHDQSARVSALEAEAAESELRATLIEYNLGEVDAAINAVNAAIASGMDWRELETMVREERRAGNPVAGLIHSLQLDANRVTLLLANNLDEKDDSEEAQTRPATKVPVDLGLSAYANAREHHEARKRQLQKRDKTLAANEAALKAAEKKAAAQLANLRSGAAAAQVVRKAAWYERFHWFISSENFLVISGRDAQQNELIVKRYFRKGDVYVHAELHGASSTVVRNNDPSKPIPPLTLQQAGCACVCRSRAWEQKVVTSAYWVHHHQVSKTAPTGEYLPTGSFMIRGRKNYLPPQPLVFGFGFMFKLDDSSIGRHVGERAVRGGLDDEEQSASTAAAFARYGTGGVTAASPGDDREEEGEGGEEDESVSGTLSAAASSALDRFLDGGGDVLASGASFKRYGLSYAASADAPPPDGAGADGGSSGAGGGGGGGGANKPRISAAERAAMKKAGKQPAAAAGGKQQGGGSKPSAGKPPTGQQQQGGGGKGGGKGGGGGVSAEAEAAARAATRGKKGKAAKKGAKYADQDEDDRALALALLGSAGQKKSKAQRRDERKAKREAKRGGGALPGGLAGEEMEEAIRKATGRQFGDVTATGDEEEGGSSSGGGSSDGEEGSAAVEGGQREAAPAESAAGAAAAVADTPAAAATEAEGGEEEEVIGGGGDGGEEEEEGEDEAALLAAAADEAEAAEISALLAEENVAEADYGDTDAGAAQALRELDSLTGQPRADDTLLHAVIVCGPYSAMTAYKYKVKLVPGTLKKGKAARAAPTRSPARRLRRSRTLVAAAAAVGKRGRGS